MLILSSLMVTLLVLGVAQSVLSIKLIQQLTSLRKWRPGSNISTTRLRC